MADALPTVTKKATAICVQQELDIKLQTMLSNMFEASEKRMTARSEEAENIMLNNRKKADEKIEALINQKMDKMADPFDKKVDVLQSQVQDLALQTFQNRP